MIRKMLAVDGVEAVCQFRDNGEYIAGHGQMADEQLAALAHFAHEYKRIVQGNADQLSMFTGIRGWTPPAGWIVRGSGKSVCGVGNLVCVMDDTQGSLSEVMRELEEAARF